MSPVRDWLDYLEAFSALGGFIAALVALLVATLSARDARRSAKLAERASTAAERTAHAAEETARSSREEVELTKAELARAPVLELAAETAPLRAADVVLSVQLRNVGDRAADRAVLNVFAPRSVSINPCENARGGQARSVPMHHDRRPPPDADVEGLEWHYVIQDGDVRPHLTTPFHFRLRSPTPATHRIAVLAIHPDAGRAPFWWKDVEFGA